MDDETNNLLRLPARAQQVHPRYARVERERLGVCLAVAVANLSPDALAAVSWCIGTAEDARDTDARQMLLFRRPG